jgi:hypothetical protein
VILTAVMAHQRKLIRHAVAALLISANTAAADRVTPTRVEPLGKNLPAISVYALGDENDVETATNSAPRQNNRTLKLEITAWVAHRDSAPCDDAMDDIAEQIEAAMAADSYLADTAADCVYESTVIAVVEVDGHSDPEVGIIVLTYQVTFNAYEGATATDDFESADVQQAPVGGIPGDTPVVEDTFNPRTP